MHDYRTTKISLPSGQMIEIIYLIDPDAATAPVDDEQAATSLDIELPMHCCPHCSSDLVYPLSWQECEGGTWTIERRCPNCEWHDSGSFDQAAIEPFDDIIEVGTEELLMELRTWSHQNMHDDIERLIAAINEDQIQPIDF
jgi:hypothetical protein